MLIMVTRKQKIGAPSIVCLDLLEQSISSETTFLMASSPSLMTLLFSWDCFTPI
jgi:hypothetical protein